MTHAKAGQKDTSGEGATRLGSAGIAPGPNARVAPDSLRKPWRWGVAGACFYAGCLLLDVLYRRDSHILEMDRGCMGGGPLYWVLNLPAELLAKCVAVPAVAPMVAGDNGPSIEAMAAWRAGPFVLLGVLSYGVVGLLFEIALLWLAGLALRPRGDAP